MAQRTAHGGLPIELDQFGGDPLGGGCRALARNERPRAAVVVATSCLSRLVGARHRARLEGRDASSLRRAVKGQLGRPAGPACRPASRPIGGEHPHPGQMVGLDVADIPDQEPGRLVEGRPAPAPPHHARPGGRDQIDEPVEIDGRPRRHGNRRQRAARGGPQDPVIAAGGAREPERAGATGGTLGQPPGQPPGEIVPGDVLDSWQGRSAAAPPVHQPAGHRDDRRQGPANRQGQHLLGRPAARRVGRQQDHRRRAVDERRGRRPDRLGGRASLVHEPEFTDPAPSEPHVGSVGRADPEDQRLAGQRPGGGTRRQRIHGSGNVARRPDPRQDGLAAKPSEPASGHRGHKASGVWQDVRVESGVGLEPAKIPSSPRGLLDQLARITQIANPGQLFFSAVAASIRRAGKE
jgi:hypothetical protein